MYGGDKLKGQMYSTSASADYSSQRDIYAVLKASGKSSVIVE